MRESEGREQTEAPPRMGGAVSTTSSVVSGGNTQASYSRDFRLVEVQQTFYPSA
jgi:hypothetical protein